MLKNVKTEAVLVKRGFCMKVKRAVEKNRNKL